MDPAADLAVQLHDLGDRHTYLLAASELLEGLFSANLVMRASVDYRAKASEIRSFPREHPFGDQAQLLIDVYADHPLRQVLLGEGDPQVWRPRRISDVATDLQLRRTRAYSDGLRGRGNDRELGITVQSWGPYGYTGWGIGRTRTDFTDAEVELATHIQPVLRLLDLAYSGGPPHAGRAEEFGLTAREHEILQLLGKGLTGGAIGHLLGISPRTVGKHLEHAYTKLGCTNRVDALRLLAGEGKSGA